MHKVTQPINQTVIPAGFKRTVVEVPHREYPKPQHSLPPSVWYFSIAGISLIIGVMFLHYKCR